jgi:hypothetical protein
MDQKQPTQKYPLLIRAIKQLELFVNIWVYQVLSTNIQTDFCIN